MYAIIDSGTTNSRIYLVDDAGAIVASAFEKVGVRDTSITGTRDKLRNGLTALFHKLLAENGVPLSEIQFAAASGMITSEVGLIELPHLVAPVGLAELGDGVYLCTDPAVLPIGCPIYFIRGVRNRYAAHATIHDLHDIDFMRGEEAQCMGILDQMAPTLPCSIVVLSSHTKIIYIDALRRIAASTTTISGQLYEALLQATNIGKSLTPTDGETAYGYSESDIIDVAADCVEHDGIVRTLLMPRFMQVLLQTDSAERRLFTDAAIAADDMKAFAEMRARGLLADSFILFGHAERCRLYERMLREKLGVTGTIRTVSDPAAMSELTVHGVRAVIQNMLQKEK